MTWKPVPGALSGPLRQRRVLPNGKTVVDASSGRQNYKVRGKKGAQPLKKAAASRFAQMRKMRGKNG